MYRLAAHAFRLAKAGREPANSLFHVGPTYAMKRPPSGGRFDGLSLAVYWLSRPP
jgi:hypothetical protein